MQRLEDLVINTPNGPMKIQQGFYVSLIDSVGTAWTFGSHELSISGEDSVASSGAVDKLSMRLMSINEDYIGTLKRLANLNKKEEKKEDESN